jgi:aerobic carbon-monoxide dehydrogenase medium subunit
MKSAPFEHYAPSSLDEALALAAEHGDEQKIIAGGQSLLPMMNFRLAQPPRLVDINGLDELATLTADESGGLVIGARTRQSEVMKSTLVAERAPLLVEALRFVGHQHTRNRGTAVGSIVHADPSAEIPAVWTAMGGRMVLRTASGRREVPSSDFFITHYTTEVGDDEIATEVIFDPAPPSPRWAFEEVSKRHGDFGLMTVGVLLGLDGQQVRDARIVLGAAGDRPLRAGAAEALLEQGAPNEEVADSVIEDIDPSSDIHGSAAYRKKLARVLTRRALDRAMAGG